MILLPKVGSSCSLLKVIKESRLMERKVCIILDASNARGWGGGQRGRRIEVDFCQRPTPAADNQGIIAFIDKGEGYTQKQSALTVILRSVIRGLTSVILVTLNTVSLQFQGQFVSIALRPILGIVAA